MRMLFGCLVQGAKVIDGKLYYFNKDHSQLKGGWAEGRYYDAVTGQAVINQFIQIGWLTNGLTLTKMVTK